MECLIPHKHTLKILCKSKHFPWRYKTKREWVFFVYCSDERNTHLRFLLYLCGKCFDLYQIFRVCTRVMHSIEVKIKYSLLLRTRKHFIECLSSIMKPIILQTCKQWRQNYVIGSKEYLIFMSIEFLIPHKHTLKILCKSKYFTQRYKRLDLVCRKQAVSNSRPASRIVFFLFTCKNIGEIGHVNIHTKLEVCSITRFVDRFQSTP